MERWRGRCAGRFLIVVTDKLPWKDVRERSMRKVPTSECSKTTKKIVEHKRERGREGGETYADIIVVKDSDTDDGVEIIAG